jgi:Uroporphyrinogen-III decarboxylase
MSKLLLKDEMTPKERIEAMLSGKTFDRVPCNISIGDHIATLIGAKVSELHLFPDKFIEGQIAANERYGIEGSWIGPGLGGIAEALGSKLTFPDHGAPYVSEFAIKDDEDLYRLSISNIKEAGRFSIVLETTEKLVNRFGNEIPISVEVPGPFTSAGNLRGIEKLLRDTRKNSEYVHKILRLVTDTTIEFIKEAAKIDASFGIADPSASGSLIGKNIFEQFAMPYLKEVVDTIKSLGKDAPYLHICGNTKNIWSLMADTGAGSVSLDDEIDLEEAKNLVGERVALIGNVKPTETMYLGTPEDVERDAKSCLRKAYDNPKGYVLSLGCGFPIDTPPENIIALRDTARKYGRYPYNPELFS